MRRRILSLFGSFIYMFRVVTNGNIHAPDINTYGGTNDVVNMLRRLTWSAHRGTQWLRNDDRHRRHGVGFSVMISRLVKIHRLLLKVRKIQMSHFSPSKEAPNSGRQDIGIYVGDRESGPGTRIYVEKSGHGPGLRPKGAPSTKKLA